MFLMNLFIFCLKKPGQFSRIILEKPPKNASSHLLSLQDNQSSVSENNNSQLNESNEFQDHLNKTQRELERCFSKIFRNDTQLLTKKTKHEKSEADSSSKYIEKKLKKNFEE